MPRINLKRLRLSSRSRFLLFVILLGILLIPINKAYDAALPIISEAAEMCAVRNRRYRVKMRGRI